MCVPIIRLSILQFETALQTVENKGIILRTARVPHEEQNNGAKLVDEGVRVQQGHRVLAT